ncbi:single-stranded-DNA-specific exonuclease RecJ [Marinomonas mediterranea]|uniref:single-stranded-DNA-specific exonuclease RecJ n=1 Tax=Marinomonas mediterranea TaxID=119864 RepID=UPI00234A7262|nr:single-stranded-DNA-specific exonuclease RecJ [Marinomonas mediterranea]WCN08045.1 single-stranded-DNA-specific exonuclease RecJ [Marinomonas mediterranea]WCN12140.1 single-stranded-DNA-specific exonuclease RecJ [Marinomonas mediterranea]
MHIKPRKLPDQQTVQLSPNLPFTLQRVLSCRGVTSAEEIDYRLPHLLHPKRFFDIQKAAKILADAIEHGKKILIVGDFDADGATSTTLGILAMEAMGAIEPEYLVPNRFEYGYGLTPEIVAVACESKPDVLVTVDNGIASIDGVLAAKAAGMQVIVTDHHLPGDALPDADAIVNPNHPECEFESKSLAGVGVIFYVMSALRAELTARRWFEEQHIRPPKMADYLDLVALGTVADVVPLDANNRILVQQGIQRIQSGHARPGILALIELGGRDIARLKASDLGFVVGPRLNAAGRLDDMSIGIECLLATHSHVAREYAQQLDQLNRERKTIESEMKQQAERELDKLTLNEDLPNGLCFYEESWHQGVIGILASRMKEKCYRPVIAFAQADDGMLKGSARSIPGVHIRDALDLLAKRHPNLLSKFGGHAMAAGMSIKESDYDAFTRAFDEIITEWVTPEQLEAVIYTDGELASEDFSLGFAEQVRLLGPWGQAFPEPCFDGVFELIQQRIVGEKHLKLTVKEPRSGILLDAIHFFADLKTWPSEHDTAHLVFKLDINEFRGQRNLQLMVDHIEPS